MSETSGKDRLDRLAALAADWDGAGAHAISSDVIVAVQALIESTLIADLPIRPDVVPTVEGGMQLEWHTDNVDLIIECGPSAPPSFYFHDIDRGEEFEGLLTDGGRQLARAHLILGRPPS